MVTAAPHGPSIRAACVQLRALPPSLALLWRAAPGLSATSLVLLAVEGVLPVAFVYLTKALVDGVVGAVRAGGGWPAVRDPVLLAAGMAALLLVAELLQGALRWVRTAQAELTRDFLSDQVQARALALDYAYFESPEYHDQLHRVRYDVQTRPAALQEAVGALLQSSITLLAMLAVLLRFGVWLPVALLVSTLPALGVVLRSTLREHELRLRSTADERRAHYFDWVLTSQEHAAELRLFGLGRHFRGLFQGVRSSLRSQRLALARDQGLTGLVGATIGLVVTGVALTLMVSRAVAGHVTLGELAMFYQAFTQGQRLMRGLLDSAGRLYSNSLFMGNLLDFLALAPRVLDPSEPRSMPAAPALAVEFRGVSFRYPSGQREVLQDLDLEIPAGKVVAVVGSNGAGKSTLVKLLCRLYDPSAGSISIDGVDLRELSQVELRNHLAVLFQAPVHFCATLAENIACGAAARVPGRAEVEAAARASGADVTARRLPHGLDSLLGTWFVGGAELSVGEWQRVALARAFVRSAPIILLDEPTSAMDSWAEADWMERFRALVAGRTALVITHRFTTAMRADVIHVMEEGRIVESGSHRELLAAGGRYAESWRRQMHDEAGQG